MLQALHRTETPPTPRHIAILGSTGSIGTQALEVAAACPGRFRVVALAAGSQWELLAQQARAFRPKLAVVANPDKLPDLKAALQDMPDVEVLAGPEALAIAAALPEADIVLTALVGFAGLSPTLAAIEAGKDIALANKETLVVAGEWVMARAKEKGVAILPVDSEHSAIFQCLLGEAPGTIEHLILTASGGPFRGHTHEQLANVTREQALRHPNWSMGAKITIDSATMFNKGLEVIEAGWLFGLQPAQIKVVVHPQSIIHSMVQFCDGSVKAQLGLPDMRLPIQFALGYPHRSHNNFARTTFPALHTLTFEEVDRQVFRSLDIAYHAMEKGGNLPCVLNAANEVAVAALLEGHIKFLDIYDLVEKALASAPFIPKPTLAQLMETDAETRARTRAVAFVPA